MLTSGVKEAFWKVVSIASIPLSFYIMLCFGFSNPLVPITALTLLRSFVACIASCFCCVYSRGYLCLHRPAPLLEY